MKSSQSVQTGHARPTLGIALASVVLACATLAQAGNVTPPPLPPGSAMVRVEAGMDKDEQKREDRAHHHKGHVKKDINKDDSEGKGNGKNDDQGSKK